MGYPQREFSGFDSEAGPKGPPVHASRGIRRFLAAVHPAEPPTAEAVRSLLRARLKRKRYFTADLFADPAWDMLLELYASQLEQRRVTVGRLCVASKVPQTTALRWIAVLVRENLIEKRCDHLDARRIYVTLSLRGSSAMAAYFTEGAT